MRKKMWPVWAGLAILLAACGPGNDPREIAEAFCYRYLIELNQTHALEIASGLAADKLRREIESLKGGARVFEEGEQEFHRLKPFLDYEMMARTDDDARHVSFVFQITIEPRQGSGKMQRDILINTTLADGRWTVSNYTFE
ncbi:MAG: hypothetical protein ONB48_03555 [candidate division KSB1 bacterium]|nr:hypothetical protein [candidate division KSB1 bacterium]MDZ7275584.1 hypothetical protein [candidate division KSB1 bacterium]MDZ7284725.1 hypothetical protein [candidate division KSB1 bacterium]MDZ7297856.1 hypothetical protein [candidate division KSB1 bacterium]MDZ7348721.1 hypothetical protein [candidate division KSB1 bacterium]